MNQILSYYEGYEDLEHYETPELLEEYRAYVLEKTQGQVKVISQIFNGNKIRVFEPCSGNSRLLYALSLNGLLEYGVGVEVSKTRLEFAEKWKEALKLENVDNILGDVMEYKPRKDFDLAVLNNNAIQYFYCIDKTYPELLLKKMYSALKSNGKLLLEVRDFRVIVKKCLSVSGEVKITTEYPKTKVYFANVVYFTYDFDENIIDMVLWDVKGDEKIPRLHDTFKIYVQEELEAMIKGCGFKKIQIIANPYTPSVEQDKFIVYAEK